MSGIWPNDIQCVALITFDVDGVSSWLRRNADFANYPSLLSMAEYGPSVATPRILDLLDAQGHSGQLLRAGAGRRDPHRPGAGKSPRAATKSPTTATSTSRRPP